MPLNGISSWSNTPLVTNGISSWSDVPEEVAVAPSPAKAAEDDEWEIVGNEDDWQLADVPASVSATAEIPVQYPKPTSPELMRAANPFGGGPYDAGSGFTEAIGADVGRAAVAVGTTLHEMGKANTDLLKYGAFKALDKMYPSLGLQQEADDVIRGEAPPLDAAGNLLTPEQQAEWQDPWTEGKDKLPFIPRAAASGAEGFVQTLPQMAIAMANPIAGAAAFGFTPEGFEVLPAALGVAAPFAGKAGGAVVQKIAQRLGVTSDSVLKAAGMVGASGTAAVAMTSPEIAHVLQMPEGPEQDKAIADLAGNMGVMGILGLHGAPERTPNARNITKAAEVHGNVRPQPGEGARQMPTQEGGAGVRSISPAEKVAPRETPLKEVEPEELSQLQQMKKSGRLSLDDARRLEELESANDSGMSPEERGMIDEAKGEFGRDVEVRRALDDSEPFAGQIATIDRASGKIVVNPQEFRLWLETVPEAQRKQAVRSLLAEESIHLSTPDADASTYWNSLTAAEKAITRRRYTGKWSGKALTGVELNDLNFGHEALRAKLQRLAGMEPTEVASSVGRERLTLKTLDALESAILGIRKALGTKASQEQVAVLDRIQKNIGIARSTAGLAPGSVRRKEIEEMPPEEYHASGMRWAKDSMAGKGEGPVQVRAESAAMLEPDIPSWEASLKKAEAEASAIRDEVKANPASMGDPKVQAKWGGAAQKVQFFNEGLKILRGQTPTPKAVENSLNVKFDGEIGGRLQFTIQDAGPANKAQFTVPKDATAEAIAKKKQETEQRFSDEAAPGAIRRFGEEGEKSNKRTLEDMLARYARRKEDEARGQEILDLMDEEGVSPADAVDKFWRETFPKLPEEIKARFVRMAESVTGLNVGEVIGANKDGSKIVANSAADLYTRDTTASKVEHLEGTERGLVALMETANRNFQRGQISDSAPGSIRRGGMTKKGQEIADQKRRIAEMFAKSRGEELPPELKSKAVESEFAPVATSERVGASEAGALPSLSGKDLEAKATEILKGEPKSSDEHPSFAEFADWAKRNMEGIQPHQLRDMWEDAVWKKFLNASGEELTQWRKSLGLESKYGGRKVADRTDPSVMQSYQLDPSMTQDAKRRVADEKRIRESNERYRNKVIGAISKRLIAQSIEGRPLLERDAITIDDINFSTEKAKFTPYTEISRDMLTQDSAGRHRKLEEVLRDQARGSSSDPESASRRLLAVVGKDGKVYLLSTYNDAGKQRVVDPTGGGGKSKPHRELNKTFLNQYRPVASILITDPVKGFRQRFETLSEFNDKIGKEASERARIGEWEIVPEGPAPEGWGVDEPLSGQGGAGIEGEGGLFMGPGKRLVSSSGKGGTLESSKPLTATESRSVLDFIQNEVGDLNSDESVLAALDSLADMAKSKRLNAQSRAAVSGLRKMFNALDAERPDTAREGIVQRMATIIADSYAEAKTGDEFVDAIAKRFGGEKAPSDFRGVKNLPSNLQTPRETGSAQRFGSAVPGKAADLPTGRHVPFEEQRPLTEADLAKRPVPTEPYRPTGEQSISRMESTKETKRRSVQPQPGELARHEDIMQTRERIYRKHGVLTPYERASQIFDEIYPSSEGVMPGSIRRNLKKKGAGKVLSEMILKTGSGYDEWMVDRIERNSGLVGEQLAPVFRGIIDREKQLYGELTPTLDKARILAGGTKAVPLIGQVPSPEAMKATTWLHGLKEIKGAPFGAVANTVGAIENTILVPTYAQRLVDVAKQANLEAGIMMQGVIPRFRASGKFARNITAQAFDVIREGSGDMWRKWTYAIAKANGKPLSDVRQFFREFKEILDTPGVDIGTIEKVNQDFTRVFPKAVTHIKDNGQWQPMLHADLFNYLENTARRATHIRAFREQIPNNAQGQKALRSINEDLRNEMGAEGQSALDALLRTMQGIPTDNYSNWGALSPTEPAGQVFKFANATVGNLMAKLALTGQMFVQPGELATGATPMFLGYKNYLRAAARLKELYPQLEQQGMVNRVMYDFSFDPNSMLRSSARIAGNTISKAFGEQALNELQEGLAAATAKVVAERIAAKALSKWEYRMLPETFKSMGFNADEVMGLMQGDPTLLGQFQRKAAAFLTSGNKALSEGSKLGANRLFNSIFRFQSYPMMKMNQFRRVSSRMAEAWGRGGTATERRAATEQLARFVGGSTAQGALTAAITALAYSGVQGLAIKAKEAADEPIDFVTDMFMSTVSGPLYMAWRGMKNKGFTGVSENMTRMIFPFSVANELSSLATGSGRYHDTDMFGRIGKFLDAKTPGTRAIGTGLALFGLSKEDKPLDAALDGFYRWRRDELGFTERETWLKSDPRKEFRGHMQKAIEALKDGDQDKFLDAYAEASVALTEAGSDEGVGEALKRHTVLRNATGSKLTLDEMESLRKRIGDDAVDRLEWFDLMLERAAEGDLLPRYDE